MMIRWHEFVGKLRVELETYDLDMKQNVAKLMIIFFDLKSDENNHN